MKAYRLLILVGLLVLGIQQNFAATAFQPFRAEYQILMKEGYPSFFGEGQVIRELTPLANGQYKLRFYVKSTLVNIDEWSQLILTQEQIIPTQYQYHRKSLGKARNAILTFDWDKKKVINNVENKPWKMPIPSGTQDKLSYQLALQKDIQQGKKEVTYQVADGGKLKSYHFKVVGEEILKLPMGVLKAVKIARIRNDNERQTTIWLAKELNYLLVKLVQTEDGKSYEINLRKLN